MKASLIALLALLALVGCGSPSGGPNLIEDSRVAVLLTDAPADEASSLFVTFGAVRLVPAGEGETGILTISEEGGMFDVLALRNGQTAVLGERDVPAGTYSQIRLVVENAELVFVDEETGEERRHAVRIPSGEQSGLKINVQPPLVAQEGEVSEVLLDFDARNAIRETPPGSGNYRLRPTAIRAVTQTGVLRGRVVDAGGEGIEGALVTIWSGEEEVTTARTNRDGYYRIISLTDGRYKVEVEADGYGGLRLEDVRITQGETTDLGAVTLTLAVAVTLP